MSTPAINSQEWWENYFAEDWEANDGSGQTLHFMECLIANLPLVIKDYLLSNFLRILDWGCAFGEGVDKLARTFPQCRISGFDFASRAIEKARQRFPDYEFIYTKNGEIPGEFDVIVTSNCLEHFSNPIDVVKSHLHSCKKLYITLVPYNEYPLSEYHFSQFREESFPEGLGKFQRIHSAIIDVDQNYWLSGKQLLVIYSSQY